jgi:CheY-like chemotaxis protein
MSSAWGVDLRPAFQNGKLEVIGFREDFEMRVLRSAEPEEALGELASLAPPDIDYIAVDPGALVLHGGVRTLLGRAFLDWARSHPATVVVTLSIDGLDLPSSAEWLIQSTNGILMFDHGESGLYQLDLRHMLPGEGEAARVTVELAAGRGLVAPEFGLSRRRSDRLTGHPNRLLFLCLSEQQETDLEGWARGLFTTDVVHEPIEAVASVQQGPGFGCVLIYASRARIPDAVHTCRALRPLTGAPILVVTDDAIRSSDRVDLLEAGADDSLSGGVDIRELGARIRQAVESGGKPAPKWQREAQPQPKGGLVDPVAFDAEVRTRLDDPWKSVLTLLQVSQDGGASARLKDSLVAEIRVEQGDLVVVGATGAVVLLQGARRDAAGAFLARVRQRVESEGSGAAAVRSEVLSHPGNRQAILELTTSLMATGTSAADPDKEA